MRITFLSPIFPRVPSGGPAVVYHYANRLTARGHQVAVVHAVNLEPGLRKIRGLAGELRRGIRDGSVLRRIRWMDIDPRVRLLCVDRLEPGVIPESDLLVPTYFTTVDPALAVESPGLARVHLVQSHEVWATSESEVERIWRLPMPKVVVSEALWAQGLELGVPADLMRHIPNGVEHDVFRQDHDPARRSARVAMLLHRAPFKGADTGLAALRLVREARPAVQFSLFGTPRARALPKWIDYLHRPGKHQLASEVYNQATIFLCPSVAEGWGLPPAEAMACGSALVSTRNGGVEDFAIDEETALLVPVGDARAMADAIIRLLDDDTLRLRIAANGRRIIQRFTWDTAVDSLEDYLLAAVEKAREPAQASNAC